MDKLNWTLAADVVLALIILWKLLQGRRDGVVKKLGSLAALAAAILGGRWARESLAPFVSQKWLEPKVGGWLTHARESLGLADLMENLGDILDSSNLPAFLRTNVLEQTRERLTAAADSAVATASELVAQKLAGWLVFLVAAVVAYALVRVVFDGLLDPLIRKLPLISGVNRALGAVLGAAQGVLLAGLLLWLAFHLLPVLSEPGGPLSAAEVAKAYLTKLYFSLFPGLFT